MKHSIASLEDLHLLIESWGKPGAINYPVSIEVKEITEKALRTNRANDSLHLYFEWLSSTLNGAGLDMVKTMTKVTEIPWTAYNIKEYLWKPLQLAMTQKESTTKIDAKELSLVYDVLSKHFT